MKTNYSQNVSLIIAESAGQNFLFENCRRICNSLKSRFDLNMPNFSVTRVDLNATGIETAIKISNDTTIVVAGIPLPYNILDLASTCKKLSASGLPIVIAERAVGNQLGGFSGGQLLEIIFSGARAIVSEYDFVADNLIMQIIIKSLKNQKQFTSIGGPGLRLRRLVEEVKYTWNEGDRPINNPKLTFRLACRLGELDKLPDCKGNNEDLAYQLCIQGLFSSNAEDTRKAVGSLTHQWSIGKKHLPQLLTQAKKWGFPASRIDDAMFELIQRSDIKGEIFTSANENRFEVVYLSDLK